MNDLANNYGVKLKKGDVIFCEFEPGKTLFFLQKGQVDITKIVGNKAKTLAIIHSGDIFGEMAILEEMPRSATAIAKTDCELLELDKEAFEQLVSAQPGIGLKLLRIFASRIDDQKRKYKILILPDNESKIMDVFLMLAEKEKIDIEEASEVEFDIKKEDIASWAGIQMVECQNSLDTMQRSGRLEMLPGKVKVKNLYQLSRTVKSKRTAMERDSD